MNEKIVALLTEVAGSLSPPLQRALGNRPKPHNQRVPWSGRDPKAKRKSRHMIISFQNKVQTRLPHVDSRWPVRLPGASERSGIALAHLTWQETKGAGEDPCSARGLLGRGLISIDLDASYTSTHAHGESGDPIPSPLLFEKLSSPGESMALPSNGQGLNR